MLFDYIAAVWWFFIMDRDVIKLYGGIVYTVHAPPHGLFYWQRLAKLASGLGHGQASTARKNTGCD